MCCLFCHYLYLISPFGASESVLRDCGISWASSLIVLQNVQCIGLHIFLTGISLSLEMIISYAILVIVSC